MRMFGIDILSPKVEDVGNTETQIVDSNNKTTNINARDETVLQYWKNVQKTYDVGYTPIGVSQPIVTIQSPEANIRPTLKPTLQDVTKVTSEMGSEMDMGDQGLSYKKSNIAAQMKARGLDWIVWGVVGIAIVGVALWGITKLV